MEFQAKKPHAAIDIGTNSMHLLVAQLLESGSVETLTAERESTRLGQNMGEERMLTEAAIERALSTLKRYKAIADSNEATISAIATSAVREAKNKSVFINRALDEVGVKIETISGVEEGRLIHSGVVQALDVYSKKILVFDIGGGSTEFIVAHKGQVLDVRSIKLGCIKLTDRFFPEGLATNSSRENSSKYIRSYLASVKQELSVHSFDQVIGCSGTIGAVANMIAFLNGKNIKQLNGAQISADEIYFAAEKVFEMDSASRKALLGLDDKRIDIITGGISLLVEITKTFNIDNLVISSYALREGILYDRLIGPSGRSTINLRKVNASRLSKQLDNDPAHAKHVAKLAEIIFDKTQSLHKLDVEAKELLELSALLHNIGLSISHSAHHKHSYYMIKHSDSLTGFTEHQINIVALIARFHRRAKPSNRVSEFEKLSDWNQYLVSVLAGILRIAIGLDRRHLAVVEDIDIQVSDSTIKLGPIASVDDDLSLEVYSASERSELLAETLGKEILISS